MTLFTQAERYLLENNKLLAPVVEKNGTICRTPRKDYYAELCDAIISQQISIKASATIVARFMNASNGDPRYVIDTTDETLRDLGISPQKMKYLRDLARHFTDNPKVFDHLEKLDDEAVIDELTNIKGIGRWTAEMFLMFTLVRPDVFACDDLGLQKAVQQLFKLPTKPTPHRLSEIAEQWRPYRTTAAWHLWQSLS